MSDKIVATLLPNKKFKKKKKEKKKMVPTACKLL